MAVIATVSIIPNDISSPRLNFVLNILLGNDAYLRLADISFMPLTSIIFAR